MEGLLAWQHAVQFNVSCGLLLWIGCLHSPVAGSDYRVNSNMVTIPAHENNTNVTLYALWDTECEGTETLKADLSLTQTPSVDVTILPVTAYITIVDATGKAAAKYCVYSYVIYPHALVRSMCSSFVGMV